MKYIYKHGNQFWYQRAIPIKAQKIIGKKSIKISLKTNKISTAVQRSKLQALEHTKMFNDLKKKIFIFPKFFIKKKIDIKKHELTFLDEFEDFVTKIFFSKKKIFEKVKNKIENTDTKKIKNKRINTIENFLFNIQDDSKFLSHLLKNLINENKLKISSIIEKNVKLLLQVCGDKPLVEYDSDDYENLNLFMLKNNLPRKDIFKSLSSLISQGYKTFNIKQKINFTKKLNNRSKSINEFNNEIVFNYPKV